MKPNQKSEAYYLWQLVGIWGAVIGIVAVSVVFYPVLFGAVFFFWDVFFVRAGDVLKWCYYGVIGITVALGLGLGRRAAREARRTRASEQ